MDGSEAVKKYCEMYLEHATAVLQCLSGPDDNSIIVVRVVNNKYVAPHIRCYQDGRVEEGILWGGDVWEGYDV